MKQVGVVLDLVTLSLLLSFFSVKSGSEVALSEDGVQLTKPGITAYADSVNHHMGSLKKESSLLYIQGDSSFRVSKYSLENKPVAYVVSRKTASTGTTEKRYYIHDNNIVLVTETSGIKRSDRPYISTKAYFKNSVLLLSEQAPAPGYPGSGAVRSQKTALNYKEQFSELATCEDALQERGDFNLVFKGITESPNARYIILGKDGFNTYRAAIRVDHEDDFIQELSTNAYQYRGSHLKLNWRTSNQNNEIYYEGLRSAEY